MTQYPYPQCQDCADRLINGRFACEQCDISDIPIADEKNTENGPKPENSDISENSYDENNLEIPPGPEDQEKKSDIISCPNCKKPVENIHEHKHVLDCDNDGVPIHYLWRCENPDE